MQTRIAQPIPAPRDLKQVFERAVEEIHPDQKRRKPRQSTPIVQRGVAIATASHLEQEKRALSDAARALAQLWKVAPNPAR